MFKWIVGGLLTIVITIFGFLGTRLFKRIDELGNGKANKDSTDSRFNDVMSRFDDHVKEDRDMHLEIGRKLDRTNEHLSITNTTLAALAGRLDGQSRRPEA